MPASTLIADASRLLEACRFRALQLAAAESCTGGLVAATLTEIPGASAVFERGFVTYSNEAKITMLGVRAELLNAFGAVSSEVARAMAEGALVHSLADIAIAISGIAGPEGGSEAKPVGLVHIAVARTGAETLHIERRYGPLGRATIRAMAARDALGLALQAAENPERVLSE